MSDPNEMTITVYYQPTKKPPFRFDTGLPKGPKGQLVFRNGGHPGFWLYYKLDPESFGDLVFPNDEQQALCSAVIENDGDECPDSGIWQQFYPHKVKDSNRTLVVRNINGKLPHGKTEVLFGYTLYVTENPNGDGDFIALDPIGSNQNGSTGISLKSVAVAAVAAAAVGALAYAALS
jgi:hypothetical protein